MLAHCQEEPVAWLWKVYKGLMGEHAIMIVNRIGHQLPAGAARAAWRSTDSLLVHKNKNPSITTLPCTT